MAPARSAAPPAYLSGPWIRVARERVVENPELVHRFLGDRDLSVLMVVADRPGLEAEAILIGFVRGRLARVEWGPRPGMASRFDGCDFVLEASYDTFARLHRGTLTELAALLQGKVKVRGDMKRALALLRAAVEINKVLRGVPAAYG